MRRGSRTARSQKVDIKHSLIKIMFITKKQFIIMIIMIIIGTNRSIVYNVKIIMKKKTKIEKSCL